MSYIGGYLASLRKKYTEELIKNKVLVTSNATLDDISTCGIDGGYLTGPEAIIQMSEASIHHSKRYKVAKIVFDMKKKFSLNGFAMRGTITCCWLKSYSFMGSNDNINWNLIRYNSNTDLQKNTNWYGYEVNNSRYRYYGIFQDPDSSKAGCGGDYWFSLSGIDFLKTNYYEEMMTCKQASSFKIRLFVYLFIAY